MKKTLMFAAAVAFCSAAGAQEFNAGAAGIKALKAPSAGEAKAADTNLVALFCSENSCEMTRGSVLRTRQAAQKALDNWISALAGYGIAAQGGSVYAASGGGFRFSFTTLGADKLDNFFITSEDSSQAIARLEKAGITVLASNVERGPGGVQCCVNYIARAGKPSVQLYIYMHRENAARVNAALAKAGILVVGSDETGLDYLGYDDTIHRESGNAVTALGAKLAIDAAVIKLKIKGAVILETNHNMAVSIMPIYDYEISYILR